MLGQIRRHIAKKNEKLFYIFVLFIVAFGISIVHYMFLEKDAVLSSCFKDKTASSSKNI